MMVENLLRTVAGAGLIYLLLCLLVSALNLAIAEARGSRGKFLKMALRGMLPDPPLFRRVMQHPLISGMYRAEVTLGKPPSFLAPASFASALVEVVRSRARVSSVDAATSTAPTDSAHKVAQFRRNLEILKPDHPVVMQTLLTIVDRAGEDYDRVFAGIEAWYEAAMERVRIWYTRYTRRRIFIIALLLAAAFNINAFHVVRVFWVNGQEPVLVASAEVPASVRASKERINWPIGHDCFASEHGDFLQRGTICWSAMIAMVRSVSDVAQLIGALLGWFVTALMVALGAPAIFRMLTRNAPR